MPDENLQKFAKTYAPGTVICREGEEGDEMYIIQKGKVRVSKDFAGSPHLVSVLEKGEFFGEMALVSRTRRSATVTAIDAVELLVFDRDGFYNTITRNARIALTIIDKLCRRLQAAHLKIQHLVSAKRAGPDRAAPPADAPAGGRRRGHASLHAHARGALARLRAAARRGAPRPGKVGRGRDARHGRGHADGERPAGARACCGGGGRVGDCRLVARRLCTARDLDGISLSGESSAPSGRVSPRGGP